MVWYELLVSTKFNSGKTFEALKPNQKFYVESPNVRFQYFQTNKRFQNYNRCILKLHITLKHRFHKNFIATNPNFKPSTVDYMTSNDFPDCGLTRPITE